MEATTGRLDQSQRRLTTRAAEVEELAQIRLDQLVKNRWEKVNEEVDNCLLEARKTRREVEAVMEKMHETAVGSMDDEEVRRIMEEICRQGLAEQESALVVILTQLREATQGLEIRVGRMPDVHEECNKIWRQWEQVPKWADNVCLMILELEDLKPVVSKFGL